MQSAGYFPIDFYPSILRDYWLFQRQQQNLGDFFCQKDYCLQKCIVDFLYINHLQLRFLIWWAYFLSLFPSFSTKKKRSSPMTTSCLGDVFGEGDGDIWGSYGIKQCPQIKCHKILKWPRSCLSCRVISLMLLRFWDLESSRVFGPRIAMMGKKKGPCGFVVLLRLAGTI